MKKVILLLFIVMFLTGCSAEVNIIINDTGINETVTIIDSNTEPYRNYVPAFFNDVLSDVDPDVKVDGVEYFNKTITQGVGGYNINYSYKYTFDQYKKARSVKTAFKSFNLRHNNTDKQIIFSTDSSVISYFNSYSALNSIKVNIIPTYAVIESNADYVNNNVYTWTFNRNEKKHIYLVLSNPNAPAVDNKIDGNDFNWGKEPGEEPEDSNESSSDTNSELKDEDEQEAVEVKEEEKSFIDEHPMLVLIGCIVLFLLFVIMIAKATNFNK